MLTPSFEQTLAPIQAALRAAQPHRAIKSLTALLQRPLDAEQTAHAHALLAHAFELQSRWDDALRLLRPYEDRAQTMDLPLAPQHLLYLRLASLHTEQGELPKALEFARRALHLAEHADKASDQGEAHQVMGRIYRLLGQPIFARQHYQAALNLHQTCGARVLMARSYFGLSTVTAGQSEYALARQSLRRAFNLVSEADDPLLYGLLCSMQATVLVLEETAPCAEREQWFQRAHDVFARLGHERLQARVLGNWGDHWLRVGEWQEGERMLQEAIKLSQRWQDRRTLANTLESLAEFEMRQGNYDRSHSLLVEALSEVEGRDHFVELQVQLATARLQAQQGYLAKAQRMLTRVVTRAGETEAKQWQVTAQLLLAEIALREGHLTEAETTLSACRSEIESLRSLGLIGHLRFVEGQLAFAQQQLSAARAALEQALTMFTVSGQRWWVGRARFALAEVLFAQEQCSAAERLLEQAEEDLCVVAAKPLLQQLQQWRRQHLAQARTKKVRAAKAATSFALPEAEGFGRLLQAVAFREVFRRELLALLQAELPTHHIALVKPSESDGLSLATDNQRRQRASSPAIIRLEPRHSAPLEMQITPAPTMTPRLAELLQIAQAGWELCVGREREAFTTAAEHQAEHLDRALPGLLYQSQAMRALAAAIHQIQGSDVTILLGGESGTGKELLAHAIHALSRRQSQPFFPFNCATLTPELALSQLFGHRRGAFTGATEHAEGAIRAAENGTLFLDEIGETPLSVQAHLLRFLQDGEIHPLGARTPEKVNVRVIAATNRSLEEMVKMERFREDLYFRLNVIPLWVPALRERREEIPLLVRHFLQRHGATVHKPHVTLSPEALDLLMTYDWPGNVRQLENEIQRLLAFWPDGTILRPEHLSPKIRSRPDTNGHLPQRVAAETDSLNAQLLRLERNLLEQCLARHPRNVRQAAAELGLNRRTLYDKLRRHGIPLPTEH